MPHSSIERFLSYLRYERNQSEHTVAAYELDLQQYVRYVEEVLGEEFVPSDGDRDLIRGFLSSLIEQGRKRSSVHRKLSSLKSYYRYLVKIGTLEQSPARLVRGPRGESPLPAVLSEQEISNLLYAQEVDKDDFVALRNQLILEMFYETGMRRSELVGLLEGGVDLSSRVLRVFGKGRKE